MKVQMRRWAMLTLLGTLLMIAAGCGVRVELATPLVPTPTPRVLPNINYDLGGVWRVQGSPHLVFTDGALPQVGLFMAGPQPPVLLAQYRTLWLVADYDATWFGAVEGNAQVRLSVYARPNGDAPWEAYDTAERTLSTSTVPANSRDNLPITVYVEEPGYRQLRAEVSVIAYAPDGQIITNVQASELELIVLNDPEDLELNPEALIPKYGEWAEDRLLLDWRPWGDGPCPLREGRESTPEYADIEAACAAFEAGDVEGFFEALERVGAVTQDSDLLARLTGMAGLMLAGDWNFAVAAEVLTLSAQHFAFSGDAPLLAATLHNLAAAQSMAEDESGFIETLTRLQELRGQFWDEAGNALTEANLGLISGETWRLYNVKVFFEDNGLPHAEIIATWIALQERE